MSLIEHARAELAAINFGKEDSAVMIGILEKFFDQWESGGAVHAVAPILTRLISGQPLGPLTGADDEWFDPMGDGIMLQNKRCGSVFKDWRTPDGQLAEEAGEGVLTVHDIDNSEWNGKFPYDPTTRHPSDPVVEMHQTQ